jgi:hypothetical protein
MPAEAVVLEDAGWLSGDLGQASGCARRCAVGSAEDCLLDLGFDGAFFEGNKKTRLRNDLS